MARSLISEFDSGLEGHILHHIPRKRIEQRRGRTNQASAPHYQKPRIRAIHTETKLAVARHTHSAGAGGSFGRSVK